MRQKWLSVTYQTLKLEYEAEIAVITLNRPDKRNAISAQMITELLGALDAVEAAPSRVAILTGSGKAFCAGIDLEGLRALAGQTAEQNLADSQLMAKMFHRIYTFPKPLITAVNGAAIAGGCGIATLADFTLAVPEAKFGYTEVKIGFIPALVSVFLRRQIGEKSARDLVLSGRIISAADAHRMGLVMEVVPAEQLSARAREVAGILLAASPTSIALTKRMLVAMDAAALQRDLEIAIHENAEIRKTADFREGLSSFLEKREPNWTGK